ncbi:SprT family zinc-dependent metalloprotease [Vibrio furnissii]|uniref:M48 family metallopeptidase n=1 Tax=Vibrio furnissii TaxID=29494 RepID=UPI0024B9D4CF|nr:SprT family zinc-dependent metalloprotease [Vibrio furnissii]WHR51253.1 SprT family zinc-dependent metalloprotease [Vibrio furnissii]
MSTNIITISGIEVAVTKKDIKNLHLSVLPPDGKVRVSAPDTMSDTAIRMAIVSRIPWIRQQQCSFAEQPRQSEREMVTGESHYLWGRRYRMEVLPTDGATQIEHKGHKLKMYTKSDSSQKHRLEALNAWYRAQVKARVPDLLEHWQPIVGAAPLTWGVKKMKTKWGSCNISSKRIWLNTELAKKPPECLEYILVHELTHLLERHHNERFKSIMNKVMPNWKLHKETLNRSPLANDRWEY